MRRRNERTRLLMLELAVVVPALALIGFSIEHLTKIHRDGAVEAAFQQDFQRMLAVTEKEMIKNEDTITAKVRSEFPLPDQPVKPALQNLLAHNPNILYAYMFDAHNGTTFVAQPNRMVDPDIRRDAQKFEPMVAGWLGLEGKEMVEKLWKEGKQDGRPYYYYDWSIAHSSASGAEQQGYVAAVFFPIKGVPEDRVTLGGFAFDDDYLRNDFFPTILNEMVSCPTNGIREQHEQNRPALMLSVKSGKKQTDPIVSSLNWDGGEPEVQRTLEAGFRGLVLGIKYRGTTIAALSRHFLLTSFLILGGLSLLMAGGIFLTYRSVNKEVALAKLKSDFVSNVSHELRTPLSSIRLYAETLEMGRIAHAEKYQEYYRIIRKESERLTALINNILDFSRIEAGRKEYEFLETDLAELVRNTLDSYRFQIEQHGFTFEEHIESDLPKVKVDREAIARSLLNLVNNAVKYSSDRKYLGVHLYRSNGSVKVEVVDHGIGIPRTEHHKIFEKFYRACDPLVHNTKGSGLGLSLVRHVVEAHGGQVLVESTPGVGSKFTIALPVNPESMTAKAGLAS